MIVSRILFVLVLASLFNGLIIYVFSAEDHSDPFLLNYYLTLKLGRDENGLVRILISSGGDLEDLQKRLSVADIKILGRLDLVNSLVAEISPDKLYLLRNLDKNIKIYPDLKLRLLDESRATTRSYLLNNYLIDNQIAPEQSSLLNTSYIPNASRYVVQAPDMWSLGFTGKGVKVAVIDTGIQRDHPWLLRSDNTSVVVYHYDATNDTVEYCDAHGTHVAGIIAAQYTAYQQIGIGANFMYPGVAPGVSIYDIKVFNSSYYNCQYTRSSWIIDGIERALIGPDGKPNTGDEADIISMSLGFVVEPYIAPYLMSHPLLQALSKAVSLGKIVVVAAGNSGPGGYTTNLMCYVEGVVCAAATADQWSTDLNMLFTAFFSSRGPLAWGSTPLMISAPGVFIISSIPTDYRPPYVAAAASGTSMATPHVSGVLALLREALPQSSSKELVTRIMNTGYLYKNKGLYSDYYPWRNYLLTPNYSILNLGDPYKDPQPMVEGLGLVRAYDAYRAKILVYFDNNYPIKSVYVNPGEVYRDRIYVRNLGSSTQRLLIDITGFENYGSGSSLKTYVETPPDVIVSPNSVAYVDIIIKIPSNVQPGTYSGYIILRSSTDTDGIIYKTAITINVPVKLDSKYDVSKIFLSVAGLSAEAAIFFGPNFPEWLALFINVSVLPASPILLSLRSINSLVSLHMDEIILISPNGEFQNIYLGNMILRTRGLHILVVGWFYGASDFGEIEFTLYSSGVSREQVVDMVNNITGHNISSIIADLEKLSQRVSSLESNVSHHNISLRNISSSLQNIYDSLPLINASIKNLSGSLDELFTRINLLDQLMNSMNQSLISLKNQIIMINTQIQDLYNKYLETLGILEKHNTSINYLGTQISNLYTEYRESSKVFSERLSNIEKTLTLSEVIAVAALILSVASIVVVTIILRRGK